MDAKPVVLLAALLATPTPPAPPAVQAVTPAELRATISVLASDAFQGRRPGTPGGARTERYVVAAMAAAGLKPGMNGGWLQPLDLVERRQRASALRLRARAGAFEVPAAELYAIGRVGAEHVGSARVLFVGHGISVPGGRDDLGGVDLKGAIALMLGDGAPEGAPSLPDRRRVLAAAGAAAILVVEGGDKRWAGLRAGFARGRTTLADAAMAGIEGYVSEAAARALVQAGGASLEDLRAEAARGDFRAHSIDARADFSARTSLRRYRSNNVVGVIRGAQRPDQAVVLSAHWDHLGLCRPPGVRDRICNGAVDNASGVAALLAVARRLAAAPPPPRSIYFVATTAEELGLLGANRFAQHPPLPADHIVAALNLDTVAIAPAGAPVAIIGRGATGIDAVADSTARALGRSVDTDTEANAFAQRQDGYQFTRAGIPSVMVGGAFSDLPQMKTFLKGSYHGPSDDLAHLPTLDGAAEDATLHVALAAALADPARYAP